MKYFAVTGVLTALLGCSLGDSTPESAPETTSVSAEDSDLSKITLPPGFEISMYADKIENARSLALSANGVLFVGTRGHGSVYAVVDLDGDFKADQTFEIDSDLNIPNGVAFRNGSLYVAEVNRILRYDDIESRLDDPPEPVVVYDQFPTESHLGWKFIAFGPDDKLYVPVGAPCNICDRGPPYASIWRLNPDGSGAEI